MQRQLVFPQSKASADRNERLWTPARANNDAKRKSKPSRAERESTPARAERESTPVRAERESTPARADNNRILQPECLELPTDVYYVDKILNKKIFHGKIYYLIHWFGFTKAHDSWEPVENLSCPRLLKKYEKLQMNKGVSKKKKPKDTSSMRANLINHNRIASTLLKNTNISNSTSTRTSASYSTIPSSGISASNFTITSVGTSASNDVTPSVRTKASDITPSAGIKAPGITPSMVTNASNGITPSERTNASNYITLSTETSTSNDITPSEETSTSNDITPSEETSTSNDITPSEETSTSNDITPLAGTKAPSITPSMETNASNGITPSEGTNASNDITSLAATSTSNDITPSAGTSTSNGITPSANTSVVVCGPHAKEEKVNSPNKAEYIVGIHNINGVVNYLIQWKGKNDADFFSAEETRRRWPELILQFLEERFLS